MKKIKLSNGVEMPQLDTVFIRWNLMSVSVACWMLSAWVIG